MKIFFGSIFLLCILSHQIQGKENSQADLGFESNQFNTNNKLPLNWIEWGHSYQLLLDSTDKHTGKYSMKIASPASDEANFGAIATMLPAKYQGKAIELKAYMKLKDVEGRAGLIMRIDDANSEVLEFDNMNAKNIHGNRDWMMYSIKLNLPQNAKKIYIGAILSGVGTIWIDDFQVLIDGKALDNTPLKKHQEDSSNQDKEFDQGSSLNFNTISSEKVKDLQLLALVWGFLKYYHPAVAKGKYNWDYELIRMIAAITKTKESTERDALLSQWINKLGPTTYENLPSIKKEDLKFSADLTWIDQIEMSSELKNSLNKIVYVKREEKNYYVELEPGVRNPKFNNENRYPDMKFSDTGLRLVSLFRYWNMIQYFFPYRNLLDEDWKSTLLQFIPTFIQADNEVAYKLKVLELIGTIHDTHANIWGDDKIDSLWGKRALPIELKFISDTLIVSSILDKDWALKSDIRQGDIILKKEGISTNKILKEKLKYCPASNYPTQLRNLAGLLNKSNETHIEYEINRQGKISTIHCSTIDEESYHKLLYFKKEDTCFKILDHNIAYLNMGNIKEHNIPDYFEAAKNTKGLIIDIRNYPAAFTIFSLGKFLMPTQIPMVRWSCTDLTYPGTFTYKYTTSVGNKKNDNYYKGKVIILVNEETQSMAEYTAMAFRVAPNAKVIGSTTAGADGNVSKIILPGNIRTTISGIGVYYPDGSETQRVGIIPDIEIKPSVQGIANNQDEVLEKAIEMIN